ncbi:MAG TPA: S-methyl-5'-thioadenosine phosphorylase [Alphaproteobacteria bacterium]|nr:S-methyl-5'-thioadenosine phosphorylase [Alphaproteobacteria bacterium]
MLDKKPFLGIIGGSGIYELNNIVNAKWLSINSLFGQPSDNILTGSIDGINIAFLPRHGKNHSLLPSAINYRANIDCLKSLGVTDIISLSAVGSLKNKIKPGNFVIVDQFIDRTFARSKTFFDEGIVAHVSMAKPVSEQLSKLILKSAPKDINISLGGTYLAMEGPQFSTLAESELYRSWNCDVIGMTNMPEAKLAREAEMAYATIAMVTDYDCWHPDHDAVTVDNIIVVLNNNSKNAKKLVLNIIKNISQKTWTWDDPAYTALENAIITPKEAQPEKAKQKLQNIAKNYL